MIQTVLGSVPVDQIKFCHSHEHLFLAEGQPAKINPALRIDNYQLTIEELKSFKKVGGTTVVDCQPIGSGRMEQHLVDASKDTGVQIIASTGFHKLSFYPGSHWIHTYSQSQLEDIFTHELTRGMFVKTDNKKPSKFIPHLAGTIKTAIDEEREKDSEKKWFYAAAKASKKTGTPIICHTESSKQGEILSEFYIDCGVNPEQIIICHLDRHLGNLEAHKKIADKGVFIEYDTIGRFKYHSDSEEASIIIQMLEWGLEDSILLGLDTTRQRLKSYGGSIGLDYIKKNFIPTLKKYGVSDRVIEKMMVHNPRKALSKNKGEI